MKAECVDSKDAPEGYYAVAGNYHLGCNGCEFTEGCSGVRCQPHDREDGHDVIFKKIPANVSPSSTKRLVIRHDYGDVGLLFEGDSVCRINILNYGDISAQEVARCPTRSCCSMNAYSPGTHPLSPVRKHIYHIEHHTTLHTLPFPFVFHSFSSINPLTHQHASTPYTRGYYL
jgi:hypothetical protein